jgi:uncharacterized protein YceH (UPF0502 family)
MTDIISITARHPVGLTIRAARNAQPIAKSTMNSTPDAISRPPMRALTPIEARVLSVLVEKQHTVPDTYPLSLNSLTSGCNQKTARAPVMNVTDAEVLTAIDGLKRLSLVLEGSSSRVPRFEHNLNRVLGVPSQSAALLTVLMLRGPQTAAELRLNASRLHDFADISSVEVFLQELAEHEPARVVKLPRTPGERESRWMHLLCGEVSVAASEGYTEEAERRVSDDTSLAAEVETLKADQKRLGEEVARLQALVRHMAAELGIALDGVAPPES